MKINKGFTLIELLVVVLIIGILAAIAVPQYQKAVIKSRLSTIKAITNAMAQAQERDYLQNGAFTQDITQLDITLPPGGTLNETKDVITYDWGQCRSIDKNNAQCQLLKNDNLLLRYLVYHSHTGNIYANRKYCQAMKDTIYAKVCQEDSRAETCENWAEVIYTCEYK